MTSQPARDKPPQPRLLHASARSDGRCVLPWSSGLPVRHSGSALAARSCPRARARPETRDVAGRLGTTRDVADLPYRAGAIRARCEAAAAAAPVRHALAAGAVEVAEAAAVAAA